MNPQPAGSPLDLEAIEVWFKEELPISSVDRISNKYGLALIARIRELEAAERLLHDMAAYKTKLETQVAPTLPDSRTGAEAGITGETSDGYHTFNELYEHRHALFAVACRFLDGWKSKLHDDGTMFDGWFIAGLNTDQGQATYHLPIRLWGRFPGVELAKAPAWDGHTPKDVVDRVWAILAALAPHPPQPSVEAIKDLGHLLDFMRQKYGEILAMCHNPGRMEEIIASVSTLVIEPQGPTEGKAG